MSVELCRGSGPGCPVVPFYPSSAYVSYARRGANTAHTQRAGEPGFLDLSLSIYRPINLPYLSTYLDLRVARSRAVRPVHLQVRPARRQPAEGTPPVEIAVGLLQQLGATDFKDATRPTLPLLPLLLLIPVADSLEHIELLFRHVEVSDGFSPETVAVCVAGGEVTSDIKRP